jgi:dethiobiotin synthetase
MRYSFPKTRGIFITGTDTGVGKTIITAALARHLVNRGKRVAIFKPIATGCEMRGNTLVSSDALFLAHCGSTDQSPEQISPVRYAQPLAPLVASRLSNRPIDWTVIIQTYQTLVLNYDIVLVEGIGGIMVPLEKDFLVLDLMEAMALPTLIVARADLGTINHSLLTIQACKSRHLAIAGLILNQSQPSDNPLALQSNPGILAELSGQSVLASIAYDEACDVEKLDLSEAIVSVMQPVGRGWE